MKLQQFFKEEVNGDIRLVNTFDFENQMREVYEEKMSGHHHNTSNGMMKKVASIPVPEFFSGDIDLVMFSKCRENGDAKGAKIHMKKYLLRNPEWKIHNI